MTQDQVLDTMFAQNMPAGLQGFCIFLLVLGIFFGLGWLISLWDGSD